MDNPNRDQTAGKVDQIAGNAKEDAGVATGNRGLTDEGTQQKHVGIDRERAGDERAAEERPSSAAETITEGVGQAVKDAADR
jgi:uncharacterized protein YjbJ (UPF0337 family)